MRFIFFAFKSSLKFISIHDISFIFPLYDGRVTCHVVKKLRNKTQAFTTHKSVSKQHSITVTYKHEQLQAYLTAITFNYISNSKITAGVQEFSKNIGAASKF